MNEIENLKARIEDRAKAEQQRREQESSLAEKRNELSAEWDKKVAPHLKPVSTTINALYETAKLPTRLDFSQGQPAQRDTYRVRNAWFSLHDQHGKATYFELLLKAPSTIELMDHHGHKENTGTFIAKCELDVFTSEWLTERLAGLIER